MTISRNRLPLSVKIGFGFCDLGGNLFFTVMGFYLLYFLTDTVGLEPSLAGTALLIGKIWDAVTDPVVGMLSDRTRTPWGRRKPWIVAGAVLLFGGMLLMFRVPSFRTQRALFLWAAGAYCFLNTAYTFVNIPYGALTPELTTDYHERTVLNGYRQFFAICGTFLGAGIVLPLVGAFPTPEEGWFQAALVLGGIMGLSALVTAGMVPERSSKKGVLNQRLPSAAESGDGFLAQTLEVLKQRTFLLVLIPWTLHISGVTLIQSSLVYYFEYIYRYKAGFQIALMILLVSALLCIPLWIRISRRIGKREVYNLGMSIFAATVLVFFFLGHRSGITTAYLLMVPAGIGFSVQYAMPFAILPDVVEWDRAERGKRREGIYYGLWTFASKTGQALAAAAAGWILSLFRYVPLAPVQSPSALLGIRLLAGVIPAFLFLLGARIHRRFPIDREAYRKIEEKIQGEGGSS